MTIGYKRRFVIDWKRERKELEKLNKEIKLLEKLLSLFRKFGRMPTKKEANDDDNPVDQFNRCVGGCKTTEKIFPKKE